MIGIKLQRAICDLFQRERKHWTAALEGVMMARFAIAGQ